MVAVPDIKRVRLAEIVASLSKGIDLGFSQPIEHVLRQRLIARRIADRGRVTAPRTSLPEIRTPFSCRPGGFRGLASDACYSAVIHRPPERWRRTPKQRPTTPPCRMRQSSLGSPPTRPVHGPPKRRGICAGSYPQRSTAHLQAGYRRLGVAGMVRPMDTEQTRQLIEDYYAASAAGDRDRLQELLAEEVEWIPAKTVPAKPQTGRRVVSSIASGRGRETMFDMATFTLTRHRTLVDGDTAVVQQAISAMTKDGNQYDNEYCWVYTCQDGQIAKMVEYVDTLHASRVFGW